MWNFVWAVMEHVQICVYLMYCLAFDGGKRAGNVEYAAILLRLSVCFYG